VPFSKIFSSSRSLDLLKKGFESPGKVVEFHQSVDTLQVKLGRFVRRPFGRKFNFLVFFRQLNLNLQFSGVFITTSPDTDRSSLFPHSSTSCASNCVHTLCYRSAQSHCKSDSNIPSTISQIAIYSRLSTVTICRTACKILNVFKPIKKVQNIVTLTS
jgi:hypothetical protein